MSRLESELARISAILTRREVPFAVTGGLAVAARAEPRFTRDIDLVVAVRDDREAERLIGDLIAVGYAVTATVEQEKIGRLATARLLPPGEPEGGIVVDLLFASSGIEPEVVASAEPVELFPGLVSRVASAAHLIALKVLSHDERRPQDALDLTTLLESATGQDLETARQALRLITERGFHRGRDLERMLERFLSGP